MRSKPVRTAFVLALCLTATFSAPAAAKKVVGYVEEVIVYPGAFKLMAKIDTGALTCSLHAEEIKVFKRQGALWVSYCTRLPAGEPTATRKSWCKITW